MEKVIVIGSNGQLGTDVCKVFNEQRYKVLQLTHEDIEVSELNSCYNLIKDIKPSIVINTSAFHDVEKCEYDIGKAYAVNAYGARNLALSSKSIDAKFVHISTDYVFDGEKKDPYNENDQPSPLNVYGKSKLAGERTVADHMEKYFILRTSALYGKSMCRSKNAPNFIDRMVELSKTRNVIRVVDNEVVSPTSTESLANQILTVVKSSAFGLYHATSYGSCSWHKFTNGIFSRLGIKTKLEIADPGEFSTDVKRPRYTVLDNLNLRENGLHTMPHWIDSLERYLEERYNK